jgi:hypothetical protein
VKHGRREALITNFSVTVMTVQEFERLLTDLEGT